MKHMFRIFQSLSGDGIAGCVLNIFIIERGS